MLQNKENQFNHRSYDTLQFFQQESDFLLQGIDLQMDEIVFEKRLLLNEGKTSIYIEQLIYSFIAKDLVTGFSISDCNACTFNVTFITLEGRELVFSDLSHEYTIYLAFLYEKYLIDRYNQFGYDFYTRFRFRESHSSSSYQLGMNEELCFTILMQNDRIEEKESFFLQKFLRELLYSKCYSYILLGEYPRKVSPNYYLILDDYTLYFDSSFLLLVKECIYEYLEVMDVPFYQIYEGGKELAVYDKAAKRKLFKSINGGKNKI